MGCLLIQVLECGFADIPAFAQVVVHSVFGKRYAFVFQQTCAAFQSSIQGHANGPGFGKNLGIFYGCFIENVVVAHQRIAFGHV